MTDIKGQELKLQWLARNDSWSPTSFNSWTSSRIEPWSPTRFNSWTSSILFNIFINDLLFLIASICNFADDNTLFSCDPSMDTILSNLSSDLVIVLEWLKNNMLVANPKKFQMMLLGHNIDHSIEIKIGNFIIKHSDSVELLGIVFDSELSFETHISSLCYLANYNVFRFNRIRKLISYTIYFTI